jgi:Ca2+-transporting ATPase
MGSAHPQNAVAGEGGLPAVATASSGPRATTEWHALDAASVAQKLDVDLERGLTVREAANRLRTDGPNKLAGQKKESGLQAFLRQYRDFMQIILLGAAAINLVVTEDVATSLVLAGLTVFNAIVGLRQEAKAEESVKALAQMMKTVARVRRDGQAIEIDAEELVAGDVVLVEAGNRIPADGRIFVAATLEIEEAALTGESLPVAKAPDPVTGESVPLGDRTGMAYMNTSVTRGRGEFVVTATGMGTEIGHIAGLLASTEAEKTPLQRQLDALSKVIAGIAGIALILVMLLGLARDQSFDELFITGVALAVAAIPTGLPAVVTALLSIGTREIARRNAIVKRLPAVETLGSTSAICSDKTGTLTLNKMTARELVIPGQNRFNVTGEGYSTEGEIKHVGGSRFDLDPYLLPMILCADAVLDGEDLIGDPTEGALIVLGAKGGLDIDETRRAHPRIAEVPFDSDYKFMATFHEMTGANGQPVIRCYVKGAPDVLISKGTSYMTPEGELLQVTDENRSLATDANDRLAESGQRVMVVAQRDFDPGAFDPEGDLIALVSELTLLAMVGIVDPPRSEAKAAIAECKAAGIRVRMITGDHATTAGAIAAELGIEGRAVTGAEFSAMSDDELLRQLPEIGVVARVAPEDKIRLVRLLQRTRHIVAMTGDGVNDAPALKAANIGVAMGITGTEVSKEAAVMILTDDNFATIVNAVEYGRGLYDNLLKYLRFQMSTLVAYIATFLGAGIFAIAGGVPLNPIQILWLNMVIDIPIAIALGFDEPSSGLMERKPRPLSAPVLSRTDWIRLTAQGLLMAVGALVAYQIGESDGAVIASTMLLTTLSLFHLAAGFLARDQRNTIFSREAIPGPTQLRRYGVALVLTIAVTGIDLLQRIVGTEALEFSQWCISIGLAASLVVMEELVKFFIRRKEEQDIATTTKPKLVGT